MLRRSFLGSVLAAAASASPLRSLFNATSPGAVLPDLAPEAVGSGEADPSPPTCDCEQVAPTEWKVTIHWPDGTNWEYLTEDLALGSVSSGVDEGLFQGFSFDRTRP